VKWVNKFPNYRGRYSDISRTADNPRESNFFPLTNKNLHRKGKDSRKEHESLTQFNLCLRNKEREREREKSGTSREVNITRPSTLIHHAKKHGGKTNVPQKFIPYSRNPETGDL
jgi:hypothetical protein